MSNVKIPADHPRAESLRIRERLVEYHDKGIVAPSGLIAHGRGEAFDYLLGEKTTPQALKAMRTAAAALLGAERAIISVNGNAAALVAKEIVELAQVAGAGIEVNLFYRSLEREQAIEKMLEKAGAHEVLGVGKKASARIPELSSERRRVDPHGILVADVVLVPLEDGDRTEALVRMGKKVIAVDLNPLSRTAQNATITIVDNIVRAMPELVEITRRMKGKKPAESFDNTKNLAETMILIRERLAELAREKEDLSVGDDKPGL